MKKKSKTNFSALRNKCRKACLIMRLTLLLMAASLIQVYATGYTQSARISLSLKNVSLKQALKEIEKQSDYTFVYSDSKIDVNKKVDINVKDCALAEVLDQLIADSEIRYTPVANHIVLTGKTNYIYRLPAITREAVLNREVMDIEALSPIRNVLLQSVNVTGVVSSSTDGSPLPGVNVVIKGTTLGTTTDINGAFSINIPDPNATLVFSFVGFKTQEIALAGQKSVNVIMVEETQELQEIVVVGYGTQMKKDITGAVSTIKTKELLASSGSSAAQQLQGKAAGVYVGQSGSPGSPTMVRIRGINTVNDNGPLYVIDGVSTRNQNLSTINPNDIESMQILKDASAAAIYGAQAANGVVLITTKRGVKGKPVVTYDGYYGVQKTTKRYDVLNSEDRLNLEWQAKANAFSIRGVQGTPSHIQFGSKENLDGTTSPVIPNLLTWEGARGSQSIDPGIYSYPDKVITEFANTNWWDEVDRTAPIQNHQLGLSGGSEKGQYTMSANYFNQQGTNIYTYYKRFQIRANSSYDVKPWLRFGENLTYAFTKDNGLSTDATESTMYSWSYRASPYVPVYDIAGNFAGSKIAGTGNWQNPVAILYRNKDNFWTNSRIFGNLYGELDLMKNLKYRNSFGLDYTNNYYYRMEKKNLEFSESRGTNNFEESAGFNFRWVWTNTLTYNLNINDNQTLNILLGSEAIRDGYGRSITARRYGYLFEDNTNTWTLDLGTNDNQRTNNSSYRGEFALFGLFARADYAFQNKYLLTAIVRRDGVSRFSESNRYGTFPSVSLGWRISEESFMSGTKSWLYDLKLRAGYGLTGNSEVPRATNFANEFSADPRNTNYDLSGANNASFSGFRLANYGNTDTKWESTKSSNIGIDVALLDGKVYATVDVYSKKTSDMLVQASYSGLAGEAGKPYINYGDIKNNGYDISVNYRDQKGDFGWDVTLNASHYKNEVIRLAEADDASLWGDGFRLANSVTRTTKGHSISEFYGYKIVGFYESVEDVTNVDNPIPFGATDKTNPERYVGKYKFADINGDGKINASDRTFIGSPHPDLLASLNVSLTYRNLDFTAFFYSSIGNEIFNNTKYFTDFWLFEGNRSSRLRDNSWEPGKKGATLPILDYQDGVSGTAPSTYYVEDGSFLRLKNLMIGYTLPSNWMQKATIQRLRVYAQAENLLTFTKYSGLDPEFTNRNVGGGSGADLSKGIDGGGWPTTLRLLLGVSVAF